MATYICRGTVLLLPGSYPSSPHRKRQSASPTCEKAGAGPRLPNTTSSDAIAPSNEFSTQTTTCVAICSTASFIVLSILWLMQNGHRIGRSVVDMGTLAGMGVKVSSSSTFDGVKRACCCCGCCGCCCCGCCCCCWCCWCCWRCCG